MSPRVFQKSLYTHTLRFEVSNNITSYGYAQHRWQGTTNELSLALCVMRLSKHCSERLLQYFWKHDILDPQFQDRNDHQYMCIVTSEQSQAFGVR